MAIRIQTRFDLISASQLPVILSRARPWHKMSKKKVTSRLVFLFFSSF